MRAVGMIGVGLVGLVALVVASKARAGTNVDAKPAPTPPAPTPQKPKPKAPPLIDNAAITGVPTEIAKLFDDANASKDPVFVRRVAAQLAAQYPAQAAALLNYATALDWAVAPTTSVP